MHDKQKLKNIFIKYRNNRKNNEPLTAVIVERHPKKLNKIKIK